MTILRLYFDIPDGQTCLIFKDWDNNNNVTSSWNRLDGHCYEILKSYYINDIYCDFIENNLNLSKIDII